MQMGTNNCHAVAVLQIQMEYLVFEEANKPDLAHWRLEDSTV